ncbi:MAG: alpha-amylase family glycosyl hydrolase [Anaerolineae bacterium]|nr:alpha-amylase family glycosyl hydrolase [Anaerolineae bacterium]
MADKTGSWHIPRPLQRTMQDHLTFLYGSDGSGPVWEQLEGILYSFWHRNPDRIGGRAGTPLTEKDSILITYGDQFREQGEDGRPKVPPLQTLHELLTDTLHPPISGIHLLPFFPYSSDDGFSIIDYTQVNPQMGTWADVARLNKDYRLMFDAVINHVSRKSEWFQRFLAGDPEYAEWFISIDPDAPQEWISKVVRPRALPLLTQVETANGPTLVWTTFSEDQIDLNFAHPPVLLRIVEILLFYVEKGAEIIRLDAIAYLWKKIGTSCIHLEETHRVVKLLRCVLEAVAPGTILITETNVPHKENISYFGDGSDEAQMVYQFPLAPLVMHSIVSGSARTLSTWASGLETPSEQTAFFNFTASHDGVGVMPARGLLSDAEIQRLVDTTLEHGGRVSYKTNADGSRSVYELNISYFDALSDPDADEPQATQAMRFITSQAIMLSLAGVPGIYVHSLVGSRSWQAGVETTGHNRTINREKLLRSRLEGDMADPNSVRRQVYEAYYRLLDVRSSNAAFHPQGAQRMLVLDDGVFALLRTSPEGEQSVLCAHNVTGQLKVMHLYPRDLGLATEGTWRDLLSDDEYAVAGDGVVVDLAPYAVRWLRI